MLSVDDQNNFKWTSQLSDSYYRSILLKAGERAAILARDKALGLHKCWFRYIKGHGVYYFVCSECGSATGQIEELKSE